MKPEVGKIYILNNGKKFRFLGEKLDGYRGEYPYVGYTICDYGEHCGCACSKSDILKEYKEPLKNSIVGTLQYEDDFYENDLILDILTKLNCMPYFKEQHKAHDYAKNMRLRVTVEELDEDTFQRELAIQNKEKIDE